MNKKNKMLKLFLEHTYILTKYNIPQSDIPTSIESALVSEYPIIKALALIIDEIEGNPAVQEKNVEQKLRTFLVSNI